jgi:succinylarginine dihydrolase
MRAREANFDGLVGPTHNYAGLSFGNVASLSNANQVAQPRAAALQGLAKMKALADLGVPQAVLPPLARPAVPVLRQLGFAGSEEAVLATVARDAPALLAQCSSASSMWTANAATVSPSADTADGRVHLSVANLTAKFHRAIEAPETLRVLEAVFPDRARFAVHPALPSHPLLGDEGAANHTRLCASHGEPGVEVFVYGRAALDPSAPAPTRFPARQSREASEAIARRHGLDARRTLFVQQNPAMIDAGVFHNDVISVGSLGTLLYHEEAFLDTDTHLEALRGLLGDAFRPVRVASAAVPVRDAVASYLFNTQLVEVPGRDGLTLIAPLECEETPSVRAFLAETVADPDSPITAVHTMDLRQSMRNGGGPACLRLRVALTDAEHGAVAPGVWINDATYAALVAWVERHYRPTLSAAELADPTLWSEVEVALDALTAVLGLGAIYPFQQG